MNFARCPQNQTHLQRKKAFVSRQKIHFFCLDTNFQNGQYFFLAQKHFYLAQIFLAEITLSFCILGFYPTFCGRIKEFDTSLERGWTELHDGILKCSESQQKVEEKGF